MFAKSARPVFAPRPLPTRSVAAAGAIVEQTGALWLQATELEGVPSRAIYEGERVPQGLGGSVFGTPFPCEFPEGVVDADFCFFSLLFGFQGGSCAAQFRRKKTFFRK